MKVPALVIGDMDLIRPLGLAGIRTIAAGPTGPETAWSRHSIDSIRLPDLWHNEDEAVDALLRYGRTREDRPTIIYQKDPAVLLLSRHRETLGEFYRVLLPPAEAVEMLVDKMTFHAEATRRGLPVPSTLFVTGPETVEQASALRFPVIVKPVLRDQTEDHWAPVAAGAKAVMCATIDDLRVLVNRRELHSMRVVVQEYIVGSEPSLVSYHTLVTPEGRTVGEFTGRKIRTHPKEFGQSTAVEITDEPDVAALGRRVLSSFGFHGIAKVDMKRDQDGSLHLLEVNPRFNLWHHPGAIAGVNLPAAAHRYLVEGKVDALPRPTVGVRWVQIWGDRVAARERGVPVSQWLASVFEADARRAFHWDDPGAIVGAIAWGIMKKRRKTLD